MTVGGYSMPEEEERQEAITVRRGLIPGLPDREIDPYSREALDHTMEAIRAHNAAVKRLDEIQRGV